MKLSGLPAFVCRSIQWDSSLWETRVDKVRFLRPGSSETGVWSRPLAVASGKKQGSNEPALRSRRCRFQTRYVRCQVLRRGRGHRPFPEPNHVIVVPELTRDASARALRFRFSTTPEKRQRSMYLDTRQPGRDQTAVPWRAMMRTSDWKWRGTGNLRGFHRATNVNSVCTFFPCVVVFSFFCICCNCSHNFFWPFFVSVPTNLNGLTLHRRYKLKIETPVCLESGLQTKTSNKDDLTKNVVVLGSLITGLCGRNYVRFQSLL